MIDKLLKITTNVLREEASTISSSHGRNNNNNKSNTSTNRTMYMDKYDTTHSVSILNDDKKKIVIRYMWTTHFISTQHFQFLNSLIESRDPTISKVFRNYQEHMDIDRLLVLLKIMNKNNSTESSSTTEQVDDEDNDLVDIDHCMKKLVIYQLNARSYRLSSLRSKFLQINQYMDLSNLEAATLRLAIARNIDPIRNAIEQFRYENSLKTTFKGVASSVIKDTINDVEDDDDNFNYIEHRDYSYEDSDEDRKKYYKV